MKKVAVAILFITMLFLLIGCDKMKNKKQIQIITDNKTLTNTVTEMDNFPQKIRVLTQTEINTINSLSEKGFSFVNDYLNIEKEPTLTDLDKAFILWQTKDKKNYSDEDVQQIIGSYFGNYLVKNENMEWVFVEDEYGKDYAVQSKVYEVMNFPYSTVQKRIEDNENDFIENVYLSIQYRLNDDRSKRR